MLCAWLKNLGERRRKHVVRVERLAGSNLELLASNLEELKAAIQEETGTSRDRQELFMVEGDEPKLLIEDFKIESACTVALCVKPEAEWEWDVASELIKDKVFELSGPSNSITTKIDRHSWANCMKLVPMIKAGQHTISMKLTRGHGDYMTIFCGMVRDGAPCDEWCGNRASTVGWFMRSGTGGLWGNGHSDHNRAGYIKSGQVLTMQVDTDAGTLKFWVDGKPHGPGYTSGVTGPLRWAVSTAYIGNSVEIVPTPFEFEHEV